MKWYSLNLDFALSTGSVAGGSQSSSKQGQTAHRSEVIADREISRIIYKNTVRIYDKTQTNKHSKDGQKVYNIAKL